MTPASRTFLFLLAIAAFATARAQSTYRVMLYDSKHNTYEECIPEREYLITTGDSVLRSGHISPLSDKKILFTSATRSDTIALSDIWSCGPGGIPIRNSTTQQVMGYTLITIGSLFFLPSLAAIIDGEAEIGLTVIGLVSAPLIIGGTLLLNPRNRSLTSANRKELTSQRYRLRIVRSAL